MSQIYTGELSCQLNNNRIYFPSKIYEPFIDRNMGLRDVTLRAIPDSSQGNQFITLLDARYLQEHPMARNQSHFGMLLLNRRRVSISGKIKQYLLPGFGLRELILVGNLETIEIWDPKNRTAYKEKVAQNESLQQQIKALSGI